jgi:hypothetical protein
MGPFSSHPQALDKVKTVQDKIEKKIIVLSRTSRKNTNFMLDILYN